MYLRVHSIFEGVLDVALFVHTALRSLLNFMKYPCVDSFARACLPCMNQFWPANLLGPLSYDEGTTPNWIEVANSECLDREDSA